jgi:hypothetical protein
MTDDWDEDLRLEAIDSLKGAFFRMNLFLQTMKKHHRPKAFRTIEARILEILSDIGKDL